jgi:hypothetical protein
MMTRRLPRPMVQPIPLPIIPCISCIMPFSSHSAAVLLVSGGRILAKRLDACLSSVKAAKVRCWIYAC